MDWLVHDPEEQIPETQVLIVAGIDPESFPSAKESKAVGFKQAASGDVSNPLTASSQP
jgi:hypothetical protein